MRDNNSIRVSRSIRDVAYKAIQTRERLTNEKQKEPTVDEIAVAMELSKLEVARALDAIAEPISLFDPVYHDGADAIFVMDQVRDEKNIDENWTESISLREAMRKLGERERKIVALRFFEGKTQMEVADEVGISQAQVSRLEKSALDFMRRNV